MRTAQVTCTVHALRRAGVVVGLQVAFGVLTHCCTVAVFLAQWCDVPRKYHAHQLPCPARH